MTVYALYRPSQEGDTVMPMEAFPNIERAKSALQIRAAKQRSATWYLSDRAQMYPYPEADFPEADHSGYMAVWMGRSHQLPPHPTDQPQELWALDARGEVVRRTWNPEEGHAMPALPPNVAPPLQLPDAPADYTLAHAPYAAEVLVFWRDGTMQVNDARNGQCDCGDDDAPLHQEAQPAVTAQTLDGRGLGLPEGARVWYVHATAVTPQAARKTARSVAKALGYPLNPQSALLTAS